VAVTIFLLYKFYTTDFSSRKKKGVTSKASKTDSNSLNPDEVANLKEELRKIRER
jgi:hypothetical protein